jgi:O-antigen ligase
MYMGPVVYFVIPAMLFLMYNKGMDLEIFLGFFLILTLSDSRLFQLSFAATVKNIYILIVALIAIKESRSFRISTHIFKYFIPFYLIACVSMFLNPNVGLSFQKTLSYILLFISVPFYFAFLYNKYGVELFRSIVFLCIVILGLGLLIHIVRPDITTLVARYRGLLGNPNGLGLYTFLFILFFSSVNELYPDSFSRNEKLIVYGLSFFSLIKCGARTSLATTLIFFLFKKLYKVSPVFGFVIFIAIIFVYQVVTVNLGQILSSLGLGEEFRVDTLSNGSGREIAWKFAWDQIRFNFYFGKGFSYTEYIYRKNYEYLSMLGHQGAAHNTYLTIWLDTGLVGLITFLLGLLGVFFRAAKKSLLAIPVLYAISFSNFYESWLSASLNPFTIQLLFIMSLIFLQEKVPPSGTMEDKILPQN